jgi:hypothetical protein
MSEAAGRPKTLSIAEELAGARKELAARGLAREISMAREFEEHKKQHAALLADPARFRAALEEAKRMLDAGSLRGLELDREFLKGAHAALDASLGLRSVVADMARVDAVARDLSSNAAVLRAIEAQTYQPSTISKAIRALRRQPQPQPRRRLTQQELEEIRAEFRTEMRAEMKSAVKEAVAELVEAQVAAQEAAQQASGAAAKEHAADVPNTGQYL